MSLMNNIHSYAKSFNIKWKNLLDFYHLPALPENDPTISMITDPVDGAYTVSRCYTYTYKTPMVGGDDYYTVSCQSMTDPEVSYTFAIVPFKKKRYLPALKL